MTISSRPKRWCAAAIAACTADLLVTSSASAATCSPYRFTSGSSEAVSRAVAATRSPRASAASAQTRPNPREVPVINQTLLAIADAPEVRVLRDYGLVCLFQWRLEQGCNQRLGLVIHVTELQSHAKAGRAELHAVPNFG